MRLRDSGHGGRHARRRRGIRNAPDMGRGKLNMAAATASLSSPDAAPAGSGNSRKRMVMLALPVLLSAVVAALWFTNILPPLLGMAKVAGHGEGHAADAKPAPQAHALNFAELPEIVANLNAGPRRTVYVKLRTKLELARAEDEAAVKAAMPRLLDLFQTYLREMRPEELRGSAGTYRLREELIGRANIALAPVRITDVLFTEMLVQ
jgi:flagellar protein FliL